MILNNKNIEPDEQVEKKVNYYLSKLPSDFFEVLCVLKSKLITLTEHVRSRETNFANLLSDSILFYFQNKIDLVLVNGGILIELIKETSEEIENI
jgi:hypothetical protein